MQERVFLKTNVKQLTAILVSTGVWNLLLVHHSHIPSIINTKQNKNKKNNHQLQEQTTYLLHLRHIQFRIWHFYQWYKLCLVNQRHTRTESYWIVCVWTLCRSDGLKETLLQTQRTLGTKCPLVEVVKWIYVRVQICSLIFLFTFIAYINIPCPKINHCNTLP